MSQVDDFSFFVELHKDGTKSDDHYEKVVRNKELARTRGDAITVSQSRILTFSLAILLTRSMSKLVHLVCQDE